MFTCSLFSPQQYAVYSTVQHAVHSIINTSPHFFLEPCSVFRLWHHMKLMSRRAEALRRTLPDNQRDPSSSYLPRPFGMSTEIRALCRKSCLIFSKLCLTFLLISRGEQRGAVFLFWGILNGKQSLFFCRELIHIRFCSGFCMPKKTQRTLLWGCGSGCGPLLAH